MEANKGNRETYLPLLQDAQSYLKFLLDKKVPDSVLAVSWEQFFHVYDDLIRRFAVAQGVPRSDVDDCAQEVWSEVTTRLFAFDRPPDRPGLRAWLYSLVRSKATDIFRHRGRRPAVSLDELQQAGAEQGDAESDPAKLYEQQWEQAVLETNLCQLQQDVSPTNARLIQMRLIDRRGVDDVAAELGLTPQQVYTRYHRLTKELRTRVALYTGDDIGG